MGAVKTEEAITASTVAKYIVHSFQECEAPLSNLKLQKLLYYVQGWYIALNSIPLFQEEFEARVSGPVVPCVFQEYQHNRWNPIVSEVVAPEIPKHVAEHINEVLEVYGGDSAWSLEMRTHNEAPWIKARGDLPADEASTETITKESMGLFLRNWQKVAKDGDWNDWGKAICSKSQPACWNSKTKSSRYQAWAYAK